MAGRNQLPRLVAQPQQQFDMQSAILALAERNDLLGIETEAILFQRIVNAL